MVEFTFLSVLLLIPLLYLLLAVFTVQKAAFAVADGSRDAGRAVATATGGDGPARAQAAARLDLADQGLPLPAGALRVACTPDCSTAGARIDVALDLDVRLPLLPSSILGHPVGIVVHGRHTEIRDRYAAVTR